MRHFIAGMITTLICAAAIGVMIWIAVLPHVDWSASTPPSAIEQTLAQNVLQRWVHRNATPSTNPFSAAPEDLKEARAEYEEHCAACHGLDGSGRNRFEAAFSPPVAKLTGSVQRLSDAEIYFIIAHGIRNTAMPAFGKTHSPDDMWRVVLWVRHLAHLTPAEKADIEQQVQHAIMKHEATMEH
jgi:mono/diheme cytochrome c family protein